MKWRVQQSVIRGTGPAKWITLGTVEADTEEDVESFSEKEWGLAATDIYRVTVIIEEEHAQYLYRSVCEFLEEIDSLITDRLYYYPETTAVEWMRHAVELVERSEELIGKPRRV